MVAQVVVTFETSAPKETKPKPNELEEYEKEMLRPGFEPGISDSKGRYA
jgi:hypothetical protein